MVYSSSMGRRAWVVVAGTLWAGGGAMVGSPSTTYAAQRIAPSADSTDFDGLMATADAERDRGEHATAARSYAAAYQALPQTEQAGLMGELAIDNALAEYGKAQDEQPDGLALLKEPLALLEGFIEIRTQAHGAGKAEGVPPQLEQERDRLRAALEQARAASRPEPEQIEDTAPVDSSLPDNEHELTEDRPVNRKADVAIVASGAVLLVGGAALIGSGAWNFGAVDRQVQDRQTGLGEGQFTDEAREQYLANLSQWEDQWRGTATGLVVAGSVLAVAGIGLTTWGVLRMRRNSRTSKQRASVGAPLVSRDRVGMVVTVAF